MSIEICSSSNCFNIIIHIPLFKQFGLQKCEPLWLWPVKYWNICMGYLQTISISLTRSSPINLTLKKRHILKWKTYQQRVGELMSFRVCFCWRRKHSKCKVNPYQLWMESRGPYKWVKRPLITLVGPTSRPMSGSKFRPRKLTSGRHGEIQRSLSDPVERPKNSRCH